MTSFERDLEHAMYRSWPAEEDVEQDGWRLRWTSGVTRRGNSVWPIAARGDVPIGVRVERAEQWYVRRGGAPSFQVAAQSQPQELDAWLAHRGYRVEAPVSVFLAPAAQLRAAAPPSRGGLRVQVERSLSPAWFAVSAHRGRFASVAETYRRLLDRIGDRARFALAEVDGIPSAVGLGVVDGIPGGRMGIFSMLTVPEARRRGAARAVLSALAQSALADGIGDLYLQVERENAAAVALYRSACFEERYGYHYRTA